MSVNRLFSQLTQPESSLLTLHMHRKLAGSSVAGLIVDSVADDVDPLSECGSRLWAHTHEAVQGSDRHQFNEKSRHRIWL